MEMFDIDNNLMSVNRRTRLDTWLKKAESYSECDDDKRMLKFNAKNLLLLWADKNGSVELHDYAYREWYGMLVHYKNRWNLFIDTLRKSFDSGFVEEINWNDYDWNFASSDEDYSSSLIYNLSTAVEDTLKIYREEKFYESV